MKIDLNEKEQELDTSLAKIKCSIDEDNALLPKLEYEQLLEEYLNQKIDYSTIHLDDYLCDPESLKISEKNIGKKLKR